MHEVDRHLLNDVKVFALWAVFVFLEHGLNLCRITQDITNMTPA